MPEWCRRSWVVSVKGIDTIVYGGDEKYVHPSAEVIRANRLVQDACEPSRYPQAFDKPVRQEHIVYIERLSVYVVVDRARKEFSEPIRANIGRIEDLLGAVGASALIVVPLRGDEDRHARA